jgi:transcriptional regulator with XRE-family HTH domain
MKHYRSFNYVRTYRRRYALTEEELGFLLGLRGHSAVSQYESGERNPTLETALGLQVLFDQQPRQLFPGLYEKVEDRVMTRIAKLLGRLDGKRDQRSQAKREFLEDVPGGGHDSVL